MRLDIAECDKISIGYHMETVLCAQGQFHGLLKHCTLYRLHGSFDTGCIWGDYFLLEALSRAAKLCKYT